jgi:hypothetical protein
VTSFDSSSFDINSFDSESFDIDFIESITNPDAVSGSAIPDNTEYCDLSGFRILPGRGVIDGYGRLTTKERADPEHPQDRIMDLRRSYQRGPESPEPEDTFITTAVTPDDL